MDPETVEIGAAALKQLRKKEAIHEAFVAYIRRLDELSRNHLADRIYENILSELKKIEEKNS